ncbi:MAG TPA: dockerin type I domain-containing protein [Pirellulales bacterium]|nr:dockerin type I domain-containing protein [Pirellulales bacterium]
MIGGRNLLSAALTAVLLVVYPCAAMAVIVAGDFQNGSDTNVNTTPPPSDPGFYNVGATGSASAIYLGNDWVLTASHVTVGATTFSFPDPGNPSQLDTATYSVVPNSGVLITNPSGEHAGTISDLFLYKIDPTSSSFGAPNLPQLLLDSTSPTIGTNVVAVGRGVDRASTLTYWDNTLPVWNTTTQALASHSGYITTGPQVMRWGDNTVSATSSPFNVGTVSDPRWIQAFQTTFNSGSGASPNEFQVTTGDSGGAVFTNVGGVWMLSGMIDSIGLVNGQPFSTNGNSWTAAFGDTSILTDISFYRSEILAHVPLFGDLNGDGIVNTQDLAIVSSNWLATGTGIAGDVNGDGIVNSQDLALISSNWPRQAGNTSEAVGAQGGTNVPEPKAVILAIVGGALLWCVHRLQKCRGLKSQTGLS